MPRKRKEQSDNYSKAFPSALRELMDAKRTTQNELADYLDKSRQAISYYCDGSSSPDWETIVRIAEFFDVSTDYLLGISDIKSRDVTIHSIVNGTGISENVAISLTELHKQDHENISALLKVFLQKDDNSIDDNTPVLQLLKPRAIITLIDILLNCVLLHEQLQQDFLSIHQSADLLFTLIDEYRNRLGDDAICIGGFDDRIIPRSDYIRFKAHEISRIIELELVKYAISFQSDELKETLQNNNTGE